MKTVSFTDINPEYTISYMEYVTVLKFAATLSTWEDFRDSLHNDDVV